MFKLNKNCEIGRKILKCGFIGYSPAETTKISTPKCQICINIPKKDSLISLFNSYININFEVFKKIDDSRYASRNDIRLVNLVLIALITNFELTTSSGKHLEDINHAQIVSLM